MRFTANWLALALENGLNPDFLLTHLHVGEFDNRLTVKRNAKT
jgi:hypothetical protein